MAGHLPLTHTTKNHKHCGHNASTTSKLIGKHNSRYFWKQFIIASDVRLGGYVSTVCVAVVCNFDQGKKETERLLVGERERAERDEEGKE